jgi:hypothetical protein
MKWGFIFTKVDNWPFVAAYFCDILAGQIFTILQQRQILDKGWKNVFFHVFSQIKKSVHFCAKEKINYTAFCFSFVSWYEL